MGQTDPMIDVVLGIAEGFATDTLERLLAELADREELVDLAADPQFGEVGEDLRALLERHGETIARAPVAFTTDLVRELLGGGSAAPDVPLELATGSELVALARLDAVRAEELASRSVDARRALLDDVRALAGTAVRAALAAGVALVGALLRDRGR